MTIAVDMGHKATKTTTTHGRGFIKRREAGIFTLYSGNFPLLILTNLHRVDMEEVSNYPPTLPWKLDAETPACQFAGSPALQKKNVHYYSNRLATI